MFELLSNVQSVPIDPDSLTMVHRGMNKVRVSVGDHVSEPSEVYIITGQSSGNLESYIIFYMLEPRIHVVYGCDQNPYAPAVKEQVVDEAIIFVEEMGSILEEVPWETMTPDQRSAWIEKEILYAASVIEDMEEVEEIEAIQVVEIEDEATEERELEEDPDLDPEEDAVEVSEDEVQQAISESDSDEIFPESGENDEKPVDENLEPEDIDENDVEGVDAPGMEDIVIAEGDFDELLKQAFLKPDVAEKTKIKKSRKKAVKVEKESPAPEGPADDEDDDVMVQGEAELSVAGGGGEVEEEPEISWEPEEPVRVARDPLPEEKTFDTIETSPGVTDSALSEKNTRLKVIKFLSKF